MDVVTALEISTIVGATALLFYIGFISLPVLYAFEAIPDEPDMVVEVIARQWVWEFRYPDGSVSDRLTVKAGDVVKLVLTSEDVIHSFFVHDLAFKIDVIPGRVVEVWMQPDVPGEYWIQCAEFCGKFHGSMRTRLVVEPKDI